jgi:hypothetical protein
VEAFDLLDDLRDDLLLVDCEDDEVGRLLLLEEVIFIRHDERSSLLLAHPLEESVSLLLHVKEVEHWLTRP